ncbi:ABC transporter ATP-binding protein [Oenococcus sp.]|uniref:ABC transporter ATP-binding protein n=1 Tax=Oenococcus sp. TaxID=1979414 RepID=UPI0039EBC39C
MMKLDFKNKTIFSLFKIDSIMGIGITIGLISSAIGSFIPLFIRQYINFQDVYRSGNQYLIYVTILVFMQSIISTISIYLISKSGERQILALRVTIKKHILRLPTFFFDNNRSGEISSRILNDTSIVRNFYTSSLPRFVNSVVSLGMILSIMLLIDWQFSLLIILFFPLNMAIAIPIGTISKRTSELVQSELSKISGSVTENIRNIRSIKLYTAEDSILETFKKEVKLLYSFSIKADKLLAITVPLQNLLSLCLIFVVFLYGGFALRTDKISIGTLVAFIFYLLQLSGPINGLISFYDNYKIASGATAKLIEIMNMPLENDVISVDNNFICEPYILELKHISFSYINNLLVLNDINMEFKTGEKVAIIGPNGSGKSTIINLITRLYSLQNGKIFLNGVNSDQVDLKKWRSLFAVVSQENTIFTGSIVENITFGLDKQPSVREIQEAIEIANLKDDIKKMPRGMDTLVGEQGTKISGGQRQRVQIARAYLKKTRFLILDESTSSLDPDTEKKISDALNTIKPGKIVIAIAHRISTIVDADRIYFIKNHKIMDSGTHAELLARLPEYSIFIREQQFQ